MKEYNPLDPRTHVDAFLKDYAHGGNPLHAWYAYEAARRYGQPIPDLVLRYFDRVAKQLWEMGMGPVLAIEHDRSYRRHDNPAVRQQRLRLPRPPKDPARAIAKALEMHRERGGRSKGRGSVFERLRAEAVAERLAWDVAEWVVSYDWKPDQAFDVVAKDSGLSRETVRRAWKDHSARALADIRRVNKLANEMGWDDRPPQAPTKDE
jgi:hypothetical protein